ncbi:RPA-related protein RADX isoform X2 [Rhineura floridana]|uniref:RPA-related protein RADX isoform X2 n=1 Tax=Rhineura floridana TaxID=261503 RepID=UPI002AC89139|nr:RPA-related protein RADX isoform X2 [Rhineura floridana]
MGEKPGDRKTAKVVGEGAVIEVGGPSGSMGAVGKRDTAALMDPPGAEGTERVEEEAGVRVGGAGTLGDRSREGAGGIEGPSGIPGGAGPPSQESWIQRAFEQVFTASHLRVSFPASQPVTVLSLERYMVGGSPPSTASKPPATSAAFPAQAAPWQTYYYDVTVTDGVYQEKCHLAPKLNCLVHKNALRCGLQVKITQCSYMYNEKKICYGFLCIEQLEILRVTDGSDAPQEQKEYSEKPTTPLKGGKKHYLPLWNNEDPYGDIWVEKKVSQDVCVDESKLTSLFHLEMNWRTKINFQPLLVRIMHKARLRYYGKPDTKLDMPYQAYFEVADHSGMMSMVLWNSLCPEWYNSMKIGTVLLLEQYAIKTSYPFKTQPTPGDLHMKRFSSIEITLNVRDPPTKINIIPENKVKAEWKLPEVKYRFITRSELSNIPNAYSCDIIGLVQYVGRTERTRKRDHGEDFWIQRWVHVVDGTSELPFILELFATSQPDIFEQIHPMTYLVCTQMRVIRDTTANGSCITYLTTSNESQMFITGWHKGQPYTKDAKVKSFIQWIKTQKEASHMEKTTVGGYYPFPPVPDTFMKYCKNSKVESVLTTISEMEKEIESLHYREHKRIAIQGIISAIRYVSCSDTSEGASGVEPMQINKRPSFQTTVSEYDHVEEGTRKHQQAKKTSSVQLSPSSVQQQQQHRVTRKHQAKRKIETVETRGPPPEHSYFTRSASKKIMLYEFLQENSHTRKESQEVMEATQPCRSNKEIADVSERVQTEKMCHNSWESGLWTVVKDNLTQHLQYSNVFPESFPCKFNYMHKELLMQQYNLQAAKFKPKECTANGEMNHFENACPLEYYEVAILGINHDTAVDVAFLPVCCPEDSHLFRAEDLPNDPVLSYTSGISCQREIINKEGLSEICSLSDEVVKAATDLEKQHVICILDICSLGEDKIEVFLNKVYKITDIDVTNRT